MGSVHGATSWLRFVLIVLWCRTKTAVKPCLVCGATRLPICSFRRTQRPKKTITIALFCVATYLATIVQFVVLGHRSNTIVPNSFDGEANWFHAFVHVCCYGAPNGNISQNRLDLRDKLFTNTWPVCCHRAQNWNTSDDEVTLLGNLFTQLFQFRDAERQNAQVWANTLHHKPSPLLLLFELRAGQQIEQVWIKTLPHTLIPVFLSFLLALERQKTELVWGNMVDSRTKLGTIFVSVLRCKTTNWKCVGERVAPKLRRLRILFALGAP